MSNTIMEIRELVIAGNRDSVELRVREALEQLVNPEEIVTTQPAE